MKISKAIEMLQDIQKTNGDENIIITWWEKEFIDEYIRDPKRDPKITNTAWEKIVNLVEKDLDWSGINEDIVDIIDGAVSGVMEEGH